jgi:hypothetical protein
VALLVVSSQAVLRRQTRTYASLYSRRAHQRITTLRTDSPRASCRTLPRVRALYAYMPAARAQRLETARHSYHADSVSAAEGVSTVRPVSPNFSGEEREFT